MGIARLALKKVRGWAKKVNEVRKELFFAERAGKAGELLAGARYMMGTLEAMGGTRATARFSPVNKLGEQLKSLEMRELRGEDVYAETWALHKKISWQYNGLMGILKRGRAR